MKYLLKIILLTLCFTSIAQTKADNDRFAKMQTQLDLINKRISEKDSVIKVLTEQSSALKTNNEILSTTLDANGNIFDGLSTYFTLISILVSIIVIAIPVLNYFLVLKPNKDALAKLEKLETDIPKKVEEDFGIYLEGFEKRKAKKLIQSLADPTNLNQVINFFFLSSFSDFDDDDQNSVVAFLTANKEIESTDRMVLNSILKSRHSLITESYYKSVLETGDKNDYQYALEYLVDNNPEKHLKYWELIITASPKGHEILLDIFKHLRDEFVGNPFTDKKAPDKKHFGETTIKMFFNNEAICNAVENKTLPRHREDEININVINWHKYIKDTLYFTKYLDDNGRKKSSS